MISIKDIISRQDEVKKIATWALKDMRGYVSRVGGIRDVYQEMWVKFIKDFPEGHEVDATLSTIVVKNARWTLYRMVQKGMALQTRMPSRYCEYTDEHDIPEEEYEPRFELEEENAALKQDIGKVLSTLKYRDKCAIEMYYGQGDGHCYTLTQIGKVFGGITRERVRQIVKAVVKKHLRNETRMEMFENRFHEIPKVSIQIESDAAKYRRRIEQARGRKLRVRKKR